MKSVEKIKERNFSYLVSVAYDGSDFFGWAKQPNQFTAQGYIESSLSKAFNREIIILAASRTDKGVHARDQNFFFKLPFLLNPGNLKSILGKLLKKYIFTNRVKTIKSLSFHSIRDVVKKEYHYLINTGKSDFFKRKYQWEYNSDINAKKLNSILGIFEGRHDFFNFCFFRGKNRGKSSTARTIDYLKSYKINSDLLVIKIIARGFLRYQIRAMLGESMDCYEGKQTIKNLQEKLDNPDLSKKYKNLAPAGGLYLWKITYKKLS